MLPAAGEYEPSGRAGGLKGLRQCFVLEVTLGLLLLAQSFSQPEFFGGYDMEHNRHQIILACRAGRTNGKVQGPFFTLACKVLLWLRAPARGPARLPATSYSAGVSNPLFSTRPHCYCKPSHIGGALASDIVDKLDHRVMGWRWPACRYKGTVQQTGTCPDSWVQVYRSLIARASLERC